ncbi:Polynucleotide adenylyltransferase region (fragment) [Limnospira indica PCC 8005]|uniref:Polynucleotide adenylyltransferase region n=1 Tax=Limnospira indica PCC 8005 TaxID=376219 RepID=A0A9P1KE84_9CYAN
MVFLVISSSPLYVLTFLSCAIDVLLGKSPADLLVKRGFLLLKV